MKFSIIPILIMLLSSSVYAQNGVTSSNKPNIMEVILFLNANRANNGSTSFKADPDRKTQRTKNRHQLVNKFNVFWMVNYESLCRDLRLAKLSKQK